ncbi:MAG: ABC transporter permease [candidate division WOR-3 bacterium]
MKLLTNFLYHIGGISIMLAKTFLSVFEIHKSIPQIVYQIINAGINSIPIVALTSAFTGMVAALQTAYQLKNYVPEDLIGAGIWKAVSIEMAPVFTAIVLAGRVGAGFAAELGTMRISEQIDALEIMSINPYRFLILPRILAITISTPLLVVLSMIISISSAIGLSYFLFSMDVSNFINGMKTFYNFKDVFGGLLKAFFFGFSIGIVSCYFGFNTTGGAVGVGRATTISVVVCAFMILFLDYIIGVIVFGG